MEQTHCFQFATHMLPWFIKPWANPSAWDAKQLYYTVRNEKNVRVCRVQWGVLSSLPVACTTFTIVCRRNRERKTTNVQDIEKRSEDWQGLYSPLLPPPLILPLILLPLSPQLRTFSVLRIPPCRCRWRWRWRQRPSSTDELPQLTPLLVLVSELRT